LRATPRLLSWRGKEKVMGFGSWWHWVVVLLVILVLFGRGRISETMGDFGKGIRSFKKGLGEEDKPAPPPPPAQQIPPPAETPAAPAPTPTASEE
jgi:sec-independent protein translocase protein TatA